MIKQIKFDKAKIIKPKTAIFCKTKEEAEELLKWVSTEKLIWYDGDPYLVEKTHWEKYKKEMCYVLHEGNYGNYEWLKRNYTIIPFEEALLQEYEPEKSLPKKLLLKNKHIQIKHCVLKRLHKRQSKQQKQRRLS